MRSPTLAHRKDIPDGIAHCIRPPNASYILYPKTTRRLMTRVVLYMGVFSPSSVPASPKPAAAAWYCVGRVQAQVGHTVSMSKTDESFSRHSFDAMSPYMKVQDMARWSSNSPTPSQQCTVSIRFPPRTPPMMAMHLPYLAHSPIPGRHRRSTRPSIRSSRSASRP